MSAGVTIADLLVAVPAAYALARFAVRGRGLVTAVVGLALLVPPQALIIPQFLATVHLGWQNGYLGLIVPQLWTCALAVVLLRRQFAALPPTLLGAGLLDGATQWELLRYIVLPMMRPALGAVAIVLFINAWNEYLWPLLVAPGLSTGTVQPGLAQFIAPENQQYGPLLAASVCASLPVIAAYLIASRRITDAFIHTGVR
jgi:multiple sugar transport system permease protein